ncbi:MAG: peptidase [Streptosporangiales bacterium]|nr:peptidase [Streptosporangiales bacterium]
MKHTFRWAAVTAAGVMALAMASAPASAAPRTVPADGADPVVHTAAATPRAQSAIERYWTPRRMAKAVPLDLIDLGKQRLGRVARGVPKVVPSGDALLGPLAANEPGGPWTGGGKVKTTSGRVFFTFQGRNASCSGNAVTSANKSVVMTAGHCVKMEGAFHTNWVFVPGYDNGARPHGTWSATKLLTTPQWQASEDLNYDVGAAVVAPNNGQRLTDVVGSQGVAFNQARGQQMYAFGFPAAAPYDGESLIYCSGRVFNDFLLSNDLGMTCDMTGGSSGGPWFLSFNESTGAGLQNSVNSFKYNFISTWMFGPYFGADAQRLYETAQAG